MDQEQKQLLKFVNKIFAQRGYPPVKKPASEFSDGHLFVLLFNLMYDEKLDCRLSTSVALDDKILNWSRINQVICFNYMQQRFYLVEPTMKTLSQGKTSSAIFKLIRVLLNTNQNDYDEAIAGDTTDLMDVASQVETEQEYGENNTNYHLDDKRELEIQLNEDKNWQVDMKASIREDEEGNKFTYGVPSYVQE